MDDARAPSSNDGNDTPNNNDGNVHAVISGKHTRTVPKRKKGGIGSRRKRGSAAKSQSNNNHPTPSNLPTSAASTSTASVSTSRTSKEATNKQLQQKLCDRDQTISRLKKNIDIAKELSRADVSNISILNSTSAFFIYLYFHR